LVRTVCDDLSTYLFHSPWGGSRRPLPSIHLDRRGIHHLVLDPHLRQRSMQPKSFSPRFVAASHYHLPLQSEPLLGLFNLLLAPLQISSAHRHLTDLRHPSVAESQLPVLPT